MFSCCKTDSTIDTHTPTHTPTPTRVQQTPEQAPAKQEMGAKIAIVHYSMYGHIAQMSEAVKKGIEAAGAKCDIYQVPETLSEEVLTKMGAPPKGDYPIITPAELENYDGIIFGISGRYGMMSAQLKVRRRVIFFL